MTVEINTTKTAILTTIIIITIITISHGKKSVIFIAKKLLL